MGTVWNGGKFGGANQSITRQLLRAIDKAAYVSCSMTSHFAVVTNGYGQMNLAAGGLCLTFEKMILCLSRPVTANVPR
jgi:hypothetical protein